jgi:hypothetical protein
VIGVRDGTEEPLFQVIDQIGVVEIRQYGARIAAETVIAADEEAARSAGFRRLAGYIFGGNHAGAKIAMTAPVAQSGETIAMTAPVSQSRDETGRWVVRFYMPAKLSLQTLPVPNDPEVLLREVQPETMGVLRFSGVASPDKVSTQRKALMDLLQTSRWQPTGTPVAWFYDPPWAIPFLRRNEVAVGVTRR